MDEMEDEAILMSDDITLERNRVPDQARRRDLIDLTDSDRNLNGTSNQNIDDRIAFGLFINTEQVEDLDAPVSSSNLFRDEGSADPIPSSNRFSSDASSRNDLLSAKTTNSSTPSISWGETGCSSHSGRNKYCVFEMPRNMLDFQLICKRKISNGATMCIRKGCAINHRGGDKANVQRGTIFVQKATDVVFLEPFTHRSNITDEVLVQWLGAKRKIADWATEFAVSNSADHNEVLLPEDIMQGNAFANLARQHKSPGMINVRRFEKATDTYSVVVGLETAVASFGSDFSFMSRKKRSLSDDELNNDKETRRKLSDEFSLGNDSNKSVKVKEAIQYIFKTLELLIEKLDQKDGSYTEEIKILFSRIELLQTDLGTRSTNRVDNLEVPTLWGSIAVLAGIIDDVQKELASIPTLDSMKNLLQEDLDRIETNTNETVDIILQDLEGKVSAFLSQRDQVQKQTEDEMYRVSDELAASRKQTDEMMLSFAQGSMALKDELESVKRFIRNGSMRTSVPTTTAMTNCSNYVPRPIFDEKMLAVGIEFSDLREKILKVESDADSETVKAFGLGFKERNASALWIDMHLCNVPFGLVIDAHLMFEHLFNMEAGNENTIKILHSMQKLNLTNMSEGLCITSFETRIPKILTKPTSQIINPKAKGAGITHYEHFPIWLLSLDVTWVLQFIILGHNSEDDFLSMFNLGGKELFLKLLTQFSSHKQLFFTLNLVIPVDVGSVILLSGSLFPFLIDNLEVYHKHLGLGFVDQHCRGQLRNGRPTGSNIHDSQRLILLSTLRWIRLRHSTFGGATEFVGLFAQPLDLTPPITSDLQRGIRHFLDSGIRPGPPPTVLPEPRVGKYYNIDDRVQPGFYQLPVRCPSLFHATGMGSRLLTMNELVSIHGFPRQFIVPSFPRGLLDVPPCQLLEVCVDSVWSNKLLEPEVLVTGSNPRPIKRAKDLQTWIPEINRFLPHVWIDTSLITSTASKADDSELPCRLWDVRLESLYPGCTSKLAILRTTFLIWMRRRLCREVRLYLRLTFGSSWLADLLGLRQKQRCLGSESARRGGGGLVLNSDNVTDSENENVVNVTDLQNVDNDDNVTDSQNGNVVKETLEFNVAEIKTHNVLEVTMESYNSAHIDQKTFIERKKESKNKKEIVVSKNKEKLNNTFIKAKLFINTKKENSSIQSEQMFPSTFEENIKRKSNYDAESIGSGYITPVINNLSIMQNDSVICATDNTFTLSEKEAKRRCIQNKERHRSRKQVKHLSSALSDSRLKLEADKITDVLFRLCWSSWWEWDVGSALYFWRWGENCELARDGMIPFINSDLPHNTKRRRSSEKSEHREKIIEKLNRILKRGYIQSGHVQSLIDFFAVPKGDDIRLVYNGTSCGLNEATWAPKFFWLPYPRSAFRLLDYSFYSVDVDLGEMFLNFPLHESMQSSSGINLSPFQDKLGTPKDNNKGWYRWTRNWMGARMSPYSSVQYCTIAEEFCRGNNLDTDNPLRWDIIVLNLPGSKTYDPTKPRVYKWDRSMGCLAGELVIFVDDCRVTGSTIELAWKIARQVCSRFQYLGIQDATRKRKPPTQTPGAWTWSMGWRCVRYDRSKCHKNR